MFKLKHPNLQRLSMPQELKELWALHAKEPQQQFFSSDILVLKEEDIYIFCIFYCPFFWWWFVWLWDFFVCLFFINFYIHKWKLKMFKNNSRDLNTVMKYCCLRVLDGKNWGVLYVLMDQKTTAPASQRAIYKKSSRTKQLGEDSNFSMFLISYCLVSLEPWHTE